MPQFKRNKRLKRITSKQKFGVRYLHQPMFKDADVTSDEDALRDSMENTTPPEKPDVRFCYVRAISAFMIFAGVIFALAGALVKRHNIDYRVDESGSENPVDDAVSFNSMLDAFVLVGGVLMMLGAIMMAAVQIFVCYPRRQLGTHKRRVKDPENFLYSGKKGESEIAGKKLEKVPVYAVVHKVQPKKAKNEGTETEKLTVSQGKEKIKTKNSLEKEEKH